MAHGSARVPQECHRGTRPGCRTESREAGGAVLGRELRRGTGVRSGAGAEGGGGHARVLPEHPGEMALVAEARAEADLGDRGAAVGQLARGALDAKPADVVADRLAVVRPEAPREMGGVNADLPGDGRQRERLVEALVDQVAGPLQPCGPGMRWARRRRPATPRPAASRIRPSTASGDRPSPPVNSR